MKQIRTLILVLIVFLAACSQATPVAPTSYPTVQVIPAVNTQAETGENLPQTPTQNPTPSSSPAPTSEATATLNTIPILEIPAFFIGLNMAGAEFGSVFPGKLGKDYIYPSPQNIQPWIDKGVRHFRYPIKMERLGQKPNPNEGDSALIEVLNDASKNGYWIIIDAHNYGRTIDENGTEHFITPDELKTFWSNQAQSYSSYPGLEGYDIMNEPHDLQGTTWMELAQAAIDGIREHDQQKPIYIGGDCWGGAHSWQNCNANLINLEDPVNNLIFEAHQYYDPDYSGQYSCGSASNCNADTPGYAESKLKPFIDWCSEHQARCIIGEMGVPTHDPSWEPVLAEAFDYLKENNIPVYLWAGGPWWGDYVLSVERPQAEWLIDLVQTYTH